MRTPATAVYAAAGAAILIWGATPVVTKIAVNAVDSVTVGVLRTVLAALVTAPIAWLAGVARPKTRGQAALIAVSGFGGFVGFPLLFTFGLGHTSASHGALVLAALPVFTGLIAAAVDRKAPPARWWTGAVIAVIGEALLIGFRFGFDAAGASVFGDLLVLAGCVFAATGYVAGGRLTQSLGAWPTTLWGITIGGVLLVPALVFAPISAAWETPGATGLLAIGYLALGSTLLAYVSWYWALARGGIVRMAASQFVQPIIGVALAAVILSEPMTWPLAASAALILAGVAIIQRR